MLKTLVVQFTPGVESHTKVLLDIFLQEVRGKTELEILDLSVEVPDLLLPMNLNAYVKRNYLKQLLSPEEEQSLAKMDRMTAQLIKADRLVLAYPIYNFAMPAVVKAWIDSVIQVGVTFKEGEHSEPLLLNKKAIVLNTSGGVHADSPSNFNTPLIKRDLAYIGITDVSVMGVFAVKYTGLTPENLSVFKTELEQKLAEFY